MAPSVRDLIIQEFKRRQSRNPRYSLRSFAGSLGVSVTSLSRLVKGNLVVSEKFVQKVGHALEIPPVLMKQMSRSRPKRGGSTVDAFPVNLLQRDVFCLVSDWYHYALMELTQTKDFKLDYAWMAKRLNIDPETTQKAWERLVRLELIVFSNGKWVCKANNTNVGEDIRTDAHRKLQGNYLELAQLSLEHHDVEIRDFSSMTMSIDPDRLEEAKERITEFRRELCQFLEGGDSRREVYQLCVQLFPLSLRSSSQLPEETCTQVTKESM